MPQFAPPPLVSSDSGDSEWKLSAIKEKSKAAHEALDAPVVDVERLQVLARSGSIPDELRARTWQLLLGYIPAAAAARDDHLRKHREQYRVLAEELVPDVVDDDIDGKVIKSDPRRIDVDIQRTMPAMHFFAAHESPVAGGKPAEKSYTPNQGALRRLLHMFARLNAGAGYVQGMNELVGHLMYVFAGGRGAITQDSEADVFFSFQHLHQFVGDNFQRELDTDATGVKGTLSAFSALLRACDAEIADALAALGVVPEFYAFRWLTLLYSQDFHTPDVLSLWDFLLSYREDLDAVTQFVGVAMVMLIRDQLLEASFSTAMQTLQGYPHHEVDIQSIKQATMELIKRHGFNAARVGRGAPQTPGSADGSRTSSRSATPVDGEQNSGTGAGIKRWMSGLVERIRR